jgi:hypothetical protein
MHYYFDDKIEKDQINNLIDKIDVDEEVHLFFSTDGGYYNVMMYLIDFLNSKSNITVHLTGVVQSAGCFLLTDYNGKLIIEDSIDYIMFHATDIQRYTIRNNGYINDSILIKQIEDINKNFAKKVKQKGILTDKQIKQFNKGKDVIVYAKQIKKWDLN